MEIFKLFESTIADLQPGHLNSKDLSRDQILNNYDEATKTLEALIRAKENEIAYRRDLIDMLDKSKAVYDNKLMKARKAYDSIKKRTSNDSTELSKSNRGIETSAPSSSLTPPLPISATPPSNTITLTPPLPINIQHQPQNQTQQIHHQLQQSPLKNSDLDIPLPSESVESRSSLDRRLSEFLKTFPNLTQAGLAPPAANNNIKPLPGYYTQQPPPTIAATPPLMAMMRFPPPMIPPSTGTVPPPPPLNHNFNHINQQENYDMTDMDLSDHDEPMNNDGRVSAGGGLIPMVASAMQQGAGGGKSHLRTGEHSYMGGEQYNNSVQYTPRINPLPFDPSIMEPRLRDSSSSSSSRDKHSHGERGSNRLSGGSGGSSGSGSVKHGSDKGKYPSSSSSSSHSSGRSKRR